MKILKNSLNVALPIRTYTNFPIKGVEFIDITPLFLEKELFDSIVTEFVVNITSEEFITNDIHIDYIIAPEARGFLLGAAIADRINVGVIPVRKANKLPYSCIECEIEYVKEYGKDILCLPKLVNDSYAGKRVYIVDDIYATGNTLCAIANALKELGAIVVGTGAIINIKELNQDDIFSIIDINEN